MKINQFIELFRFISAYYFFRHGLPNLLLMHFSGLKFKEIISLEWFPPVHADCHFADLSAVSGFLHMPPIFPTY